jgi:hypothetical protein
MSTRSASAQENVNEEQQVGNDVPGSQTLRMTIDCLAAASAFYLPYPFVVASALLGKLMATIMCSAQV